MRRFLFTTTKLSHYFRVKFYCRICDFQNIFLRSRLRLGTNTILSVYATKLFDIDEYLILLSFLLFKHALF